MAVIQDININVHGQPSEKRLQTFLRLSQNENGRMINFRVLGAPLPSGCTATFSGTKPDGNVYSTTGTVAGNFVMVQEDMQMTAVAGVWDATLDVVNGTHNIVTAIIRVIVERGTVAPGSVPSNSQLDGYVAQCKSYAEQARMEAYGSPLTAETKAQMTDHARVYVYTGSEPNMVAGNWYHWNGTAWVSGGVYNAVAVQTDTTLSVAGKAADGKATGDALDDLKEDLNINDGIIDELVSEQVSILSGTDEGYKVINSRKEVATSTATTWHVVYYSVTAGQKFRISGSTNNNNYFFIFTDGTDTLASSKQNLTGGASSISDVLAVAPSGTTTLVVAYNIGAAYTNAQVKLITGYELDDVEALGVRVGMLEDITKTVTKSHLLSSAEYTENSDTIMYTSGVTTASAGWRLIEYTIPTNAKTMIVTAKAGQSLRLWVLKDSGGTVLGYSSDSSNVSVKTETINLANYNTAQKLFVNDKTSADLQIIYTFDAKAISGDDVYVDGITLANIATGDKLFKKILCCCGDSITYGADMDSAGIVQTSDITVYQSDYDGNFSQVHGNFLKSWGYNIAERHSMTFYNAGVSGSTMQGISEKHGFSLENGRYTKLPENIDYLLIWFGWNDYAFGTLGEITDTTNGSFFGGFNVVLPYLINKYPYAKIGIIVPFINNADMRDAVRQLGKKWGVAVWDNYQGGTPLYFGKEASVGVDADIVTANKAKFQANGAHPNSNGHKQLADMIEHWMQGI